MSGDEELELELPVTDTTSNDERTGTRLRVESEVQNGWMSVAVVRDGTDQD